MKKDYHKGVKLQLYIPEELSQELDNFIKDYNDKLPHFQITKSDLVRISLTKFLHEN